jgi:transposase
MLDQLFSIYGLRQRKARPMNTLRQEKKLAVLAALVEGNSIRSTERMTGVHRDTIMRLLAKVGTKCEQILDERMHGFHSRLLQADEIWTFCQKKEQRLTDTEQANPGVGDQYVFVALDAETKLIPLFVVDKRDTATAHRFIHALRQRLNGNGRVQLTTDGLRAYLTAVESAFGNDVDYAQLVKLYGSEPAGDGRYAPPRVT